MHLEQKRFATRLGRALREARERASLTQEEVAERVGLAVEILGRVERGSMLPSAPTLRELCRVLRMDADALLWLDREGAAPVSPLDDFPQLPWLVETLRRMGVTRLGIMSDTASAELRDLDSPLEERLE
ncbi:helix-turn-helix transcriptional regulator [Melittangium boletus]|uniref:Transcriptional regulator n=1 Tax=Melittangium boletus DSM 14713 TaxID=1294270 RepID=A0A250IEB8_9BACT|nr:helix-turn-helix transcriptional regulator [Melittangium boletus]ATB30115.1 transcriptional regulator [Melittangium boletus DSM 14713]